MSDETEEQKKLMRQIDISCVQAFHTMDEIDELDRYRAAYKLISKLNRAEERANQEGWISDEDVKKERGTYDFNKEWQGGRPCNRRG